MEEIYNTNDNVTKNVPKEPIKTILYTGNLGKTLWHFTVIGGFYKNRKAKLSVMD